MNREAIITSMEANLPTNFREISVEWKNKAADALLALQTPPELAADEMYGALMKAKLRIIEYDAPIQDAILFVEIDSALSKARGER